MELLLAGAPGVEVAYGRGLALHAIAGVVVGGETQEHLLHGGQAVPVKQNLKRVSIMIKVTEAYIWPLQST